MFQPRYIKHSHLLVRHAEKLIRYRRDRLSQAVVAELRGQIEKVRAAMKARDQKKTQEESEQLDALLTAHTPPHKDAVWRENVEVILVAIVVAVGIRSYFLQPFKIPTGSMQPTLNGIIGHPSNAPAPNIFKQAFDFVAFGRNYINVVSQGDDAVEGIEKEKILFFFTLSRIVCDQHSYNVYAPPEILQQDFKVYPGNVYRAGQVIARGAVDTGDQVFVDKFSYNFIHPHRGDVFVFRTDDILGIREDPEGARRITSSASPGTPGDELRIDSPKLYVNGKPAENFGIRRVMSAKEPYKGYSQGQAELATPAQTYVIPPHRYFAMGDNSYNSYDSRYWGPVPEENARRSRAFRLLAVWSALGNHSLGCANACRRAARLSAARNAGRLSASSFHQSSAGRLARRVALHLPLQTPLARFRAPRFCLLDLSVLPSSRRSRRRPICASSSSGFGRSGTGRLSPKSGAVVLLHARRERCGNFRCRGHYLSTLSRCRYPSHSELARACTPASCARSASNSGSAAGSFTSPSC